MATLTTDKFFNRRYGSSSNGYNFFFEVDETATSVIGNNSTCTVRYYGEQTSGYYYTGNSYTYFRFSVNNGTFSDWVNVNHISGGEGVKNLLGTQTGVVVAHNADGTKTLTITGEYTRNKTTATGSGSASTNENIPIGTSTGTSEAACKFNFSKTVTLTALDRTAPTVTLSITNVGSDSFKINASTNVACDVWEYSIGGAYYTFSTTSGTSASTTLVGLSPATNYSLTVRARKTSNQVTGTASTTVSTLGYSTISSVSNINCGSTNSITFTPYSTSFYYRVQFKQGSTVIATENIGKYTSTSAKTYTTSYTFPLTLLPNSTSGTISAILYTYSDSGYSTLIGSDTKTFTLSVPSGIVPSFVSGYPTVTPNNSGNAWLAANASSTWVGGYSKANIVARANAGSGATVSSVVASNAVSGALTFSSPNWSLTSGVLAAGSKTVRVTITDSRGRTAYTDKTFTVATYNAPSVTLTAVRGTGTGGSFVQSESGTTIRATAVVNTSVNAANTANVTFVCGGSTQTASNIASGSSGVVYFENKSIETTFVVTATATDKVGVTGSTSAQTVSSQVIPFAWDEDRIGFGKVGELANNVDSAWNMRVLKTDASLARVQAINSLAAIDLQASAAGNSGVYSPTNGHWLVYDGTDGHTRMQQQYRAYTDISSTPYTLAANVSGRLIRMLNSGAKTVTIPSGFEIGYFVDFMSAYANAKITFNFSDGEGLYVPNSDTLTSVTAPFGLSAIRLIKVGSTRWSMFSNVPTYYTAGDTLTQADVRMGSGFVTTSSADLYVYLPLAKPIMGATGATINTWSCNLRHASGGYLQYYDGATRTALSSSTGDWVSQNLYDSVTVTIVAGGLYIMFKCTNKWNFNNATVVNNSLINCQFGTLSIALT